MTASVRPVYPRAEAPARYADDGGTTEPDRPTELTLCDRTIDLVRGVVRGPGEEIKLTSREVALLAWLAARPSLAIARDELLTEVWGYGDQVVSRTVDTTVRRLRTKIERDPANPVHLLTEFGFGYRWEPAAAAPIGRRTNVPVPTTALHGRATDARALSTLLADHPLVSVLGAAGLGKTRIAREVASAWPGDAWFVDLCPANDASGVVQAIARALDATPAGRGDPLRQLGEALRPGALVVVDNAEHLLSAVVAAIGTLRAAAPGARFLVTTRERLRMADETVVELAPLAVADAVRLFRERAGAVGAIVPDDLDTQVRIEDIVRRLDALPLAIELAAARARLLPVPRLQERLRDRFAVLIGGRSDGPVHQNTLRAALDWSWELLDEPERLVLVRVSAFRGAFDVDAAEVIVDRVDALPLLDRLVAKSLVVAVDGRLSLLQNIREWASERLDPATRERHRAWAIGHAVANGRAVEGPDGIAATRALAAAFDEIRDAIERSVGAHPKDAAEATLALDRLLLERGPADLHLALIEAALAAVDAGDRHAIQLRRARGELLRMLGRGDEALADLLAASADAARLGDGPLQGLVETSLALARIDRSDLDQAEIEGHRALSRARNAGDHRTAGLALGALGRAAVARGHTDIAERLSRESLAEVLHLREPRLEANTRGNLANLLIGRGAPDEAGVHLHRALDLHERAGAKRRVAMLHLSLGSLALSEGDLPGAEAWYRRSHREYVEVGIAAEAAMSLGNLGWVLVEAGRYDEAEQTLLAVVAEHERLGSSKRLVAITLGNLGVLRQLEGRLDDARRELGRCLDLARSIGDRRTAAFFAAHLAAVEADAGRPDVATACLAEASAKAVGGEPLLDVLIEVCRLHVDAPSVVPADWTAWKAHQEARIATWTADGAPERRSANLRVAIRHLRTRLESR